MKMLTEDLGRPGDLDQGSRDGNSGKEEIWLELVFGLLLASLGVGIVVLGWRSSGWVAAVGVFICVAATSVIMQIRVIGRIVGGLLCIGVACAILICGGAFAATFCLVIAGFQFAAALDPSDSSRVSDSHGCPVDVGDGSFDGGGCDGGGC